MVCATASAFQLLTALSTLEVSAVVTVITTIITVAHTEAMLIVTTMVSSTVGASVIIAMTTVHPPAVSTMIGQVEMRASEVEEGTVRIAGIDAEVPVTCLPVEWTVEIGCCTVCTVLPVEEDIAQVEVTTSPI